MQQTRDRFLPVTLSTTHLLAISRVRVVFLPILSRALVVFRLKFLTIIIPIITATRILEIVMRINMLNRIITTMDRRFINSIQVKEVSNRCHRLLCRDKTLARRVLCTRKVSSIPMTLPSILDLPSFPPNVSKPLHPIDLLHHQFVGNHRPPNPCHQKIPTIKLHIRPHILHREQWMNPGIPKPTLIKVETLLDIMNPGILKRSLIKEILLDIMGITSEDTALILRIWESPLPLWAIVLPVRRSVLLVHHRHPPSRDRLPCRYHRKNYSNSNRPDPNPGSQFRRCHNRWRIHCRRRRCAKIIRVPAHRSSRDRRRTRRIRGPILSNHPNPRHRFRFVLL